jgi:glycosyltransferase involved in cell wall biosynthesis
MGNKVRAAAFSGRTDGIYAQGLCAWGVRAALEWGVPLVANPQGMEEFKVTDPMKRLAYAPFRSWLRAGYRAADRVIATDFSMKDEVSTLLGVDPQRVVVLPNGVDVEEFRSLVSRETQSALAGRWPALRKRELLLGISVGRMEANKGFEYLLRALGSAQNVLGQEWEWFLVGDGGLRQQLEELAGDLGLTGRVIFTGKLSDQELHTLYSMCNLFAHPTLYEGSSLVTLEAMSHALPVVASAIGGIPDKVVEGETGFLVPPGNSAALAERIAWISNHRTESVAMGRRGASLAEDNFSWRKIATDTKELYCELIEEKAACRGQEVAEGSC